MNDQEHESILTLCLMAAFADGAKHDRERDEIRRIAGSLAAADSANIAALYQDVLLKRVSPQQASAALSTREAKQLAYEMAVCVCDADGAQSDAERAFLGSLRTALGLASTFSRRSASASRRNTSSRPAASCSEDCSARWVAACSAASESRRSARE